MVSVAAKLANRERRTEFPRHDREQGTLHGELPHKPLQWWNVRDTSCLLSQPRNTSRRYEDLRLHPKRLVLTLCESDCQQSGERNPSDQMAFMGKF